MQKINMKLIGKLIFSIISNALAILATSYLVTGFIFDGDFIDLIVVALVFMAINIIFKPVMKLLLSPFIILTLGLFLIVINALALYLLDIFTAPLTIQGYLPLVIATVVIAIINGIITFSGKVATD